MKKYYRIGICLVLSICLLFLSACGKKQDPPANDPTQPASDLTQATGETTGTKPSENPTETTGSVPDMPQEEENSNLPKKLAFNWKESYLRIYPKLNHTHITNGKRFTYEELQNEIDCIMKIVPFSEGVMDAETIQNLPYPEEFFTNNSLILIGFDGFRATEITNVTYSDGVLTCAVTMSYNKAWHTEELRPIGLSDCYCFIEIDTVLPEGTEIVVMYTDEFIDESELSVKYKNFAEKLI